jgi:outer membrane protein assembly factor BamB
MLGRFEAMPSIPGFSSAKGPTRAVRPVVTGLLVLCAAVGCGSPAGDPATTGDATRPAPSLFSPAPDLPAVDTTEWVEIYDPEWASNGYTLAFWKRRIPILIDMNGRVVHAWPTARAKSRLRLLPNGNLLAVGLGRAVVEYDWDGNLVWQHRIEGEIPHHDVIRLANGNTLLVLRSKKRPTDDLVEVTPEGEVAWKWEAAVHLAPWIAKGRTDRGDLTHINGVQELPENPWFDGGDERFRPGNLLISPRNLNAIFVLDRATGEVVWSWDRELDLQHEALMIEPGFPGHGRILIFDNGYRSTWEYRKSVVLEIEPPSGEITWEYRSDDFYSPTGGIEQPLPNGNVLISSSRGGRAFEVTREGEIVWQWVPPYDPNRPQRVAFDHTPQLAALERPEAIAVRPVEGYRYVDPAVFRFSRRDARHSVGVNGQKRSILRDNQACRRLFLPLGARLEVRYGLNRTAFSHHGREPFAVDFAVRLKAGAGDEVELWRDTVSLERNHQRKRAIDLSAHALEWVDLCLSTAASDPVIATDGAGGSAETGASGPAANGPIDPFVYWLEPRIFPATAAGRGGGEADAESRGGRTDQPAADDPSGALGLTDEELEVQREHLEALGYVD